MIDFFYLADYDPDDITKHSYTSAADESFAEVDSGDNIQQEAVEHDMVTERNGTKRRHRTRTRSPRGGRCCKSTGGPIVPGQEEEEKSQGQTAGP
jgi:hypothetical protein